MGYAINPVIDLFFQQGQSLRSALQAVVGAEELQHKPSGVYIQAWSIFVGIIQMYLKN